MTPPNKHAAPTHPAPRAEPALARATLWLIGAAIAAAALAQPRPLVGGETWVGNDQLTYTLPSRAVLAGALRAGRLPEWCDGYGLGAAYASNLSHGVVYPPAWLVAALPMPFASDLLLIAHLAWMALGLSLLARRLGASVRGAALGGAVLVTSGYAASVIVNGIPILTLSWTPWVLWAADRLAFSDGRRARLLCGARVAALVAAQILSGDPAGLVTALVLAAALVAVRAPRRLPSLAALALSYAGALPLAAVGLLPELAMLAESQRAGGLGAGDAAVWSMHPLRLLEMAWPRLLGDAADATASVAAALADTARGAPGLGPSWAASEYLSLPVLALALVGGARRGGRGLLAVALLFVALALGAYTPLYGLYRALFPPERFLRYPEKHIAGAVVLVAALAAVGYTRAFEDAPSRRRAILAAAAAALLGLGALFAPSLASHLAASQSGDRERTIEAIVSGGQSAAVVAALCAAALALAHHPRLGRFAGPLAALVIVGHLAGEGWLVQPLADRAAVARSPAILEPILAEGRRPSAVSPRIYRPPTLAPGAPLAEPAARRIALRDLALENSAMPWGFSHAPGYDPTLPSRLKLLWDESGRPGGGRRIVDLLDVEYLVLPAPAATAPGFTTLAVLDGAALVRNDAHRPRAFVASRWRYLPDDAAARAALLDPSSPRAEVRIVGAGPPPPESTPASETPCETRYLRPEEVELRCASAAGGQAVLVDSWAPGWTATLDGTPAAIARAEAVARAVAIPPGEHLLRFRYRTPGLRLGALLSLAAWAVWLALIAQLALRRGRATAKR